MFTDVRAIVIVTAGTTELANQVRILIEASYVYFVLMTSEKAFFFYLCMFYPGCQDECLRREWMNVYIDNHNPYLPV